MPRSSRRCCPTWTDQGQSLSRFPQLHRDLGPLSPWGRFLRLRAKVDAILDSLIEDARRDPDLAERLDVLAMMVLARREDGSALSNAEIRDQLVTMLAAGHETTAHTLSWAVERLRRHPDVLARLVDEVDAGGKELREATIREVQRMRPVISFSGRFTMRPFEVGGYRLPPGVLIGLSAGLTHFDPELFPHPDRFDPDRFLDTKPGTYSWIPFGGGIRRCIGATFAHMELDVVLRVMLERVSFAATTAPDEPWKFKGVAWSPAGGGKALVHRRPVREAAPEVGCRRVSDGSPQLAVLCPALRRASATGCWSAWPRRSASTVTCARSPSPRSSATPAPRGGRSTSTSTTAMPASWRCSTSSARGCWRRSPTPRPARGRSASGSTARWRPTSASSPPSPS